MSVAPDIIIGVAAQVSKDHARVRLIDLKINQPVPVPKQLCREFEHIQNVFAQEWLFYADDPATRDLMHANDAIVRTVRSALEREVRVNLHRHPITIRLDGEVGSLSSSAPRIQPEAGQMRFIEPQDLSTPSLAEIVLPRLRRLQSRRREQSIWTAEIKVA